jgi:hypothetical protein
MSDEFWYIICFTFVSCGTSPVFYLRFKVTPFTFVNKPYKEGFGMG